MTEQEQLLAILQSIERGDYERQRRAAIHDEGVTLAAIEASAEQEQIDAARQKRLELLEADGWFSGARWAALTARDMAVWAK